ncbi:MAG: class II aldolase/adducin family protein [Pigmentiphaga sp.]
MDLELEGLLDKLARACRILEMEGHGDMTLGHVSMRDPHGRGFWLKRNAYGLGEITGAADFVLIDFEGRQIAGAGGKHSEWPIHSEILLARPEINVVAHTHPMHASVLSAFRTAPAPYTVDADYFSNVPCLTVDSALLKTKAQGQRLAEALGPHFAVLMANHGLTFCGTSIEHAVCIGIFLERAAKLHMLGESVQGEAAFPPQGTRTLRHGQVMAPVHIEHSWNYFSRKLDWAAAGRPGPRFFN